MQIAVNMISLSAFYVAFALGLAVVFGVMRIINFAHGELLMLGGYTLWVAVIVFGEALPGPAVFILALVLGFVLVGLLGLVLQLSLFRALRKRPFAILMSTLGLSYVIQVLVTQSVGAVGRSIPTLFPGFLQLGTVVIPFQRLIVVCLSLAMIGAIWFFLMHSRLGRSVRAVAQNPTGAVLQGISLDRVGALTMALGAGLAAFAGVLIGSINSVDPFMGGDAIWRAFIIIIVGGIGSIPGTVIAAFVFGVLDTGLASFGYGQYVPLVDALLMLGILAFLPNGLMGARD